MAFTKVLPFSCLNGSGLVLPPEFRDAAVPASGDYTLVNGEGKQWPCSITRKAQGMHERADITGGWKAFTSANGLKVGDEVLVQPMGNRTISITKTGTTGTPRTPGRPKTPMAKAGAVASASGKKKTPGSGKKSGAGGKAAATPLLAKKGAGSTGKKRGRASKQAATPTAVEAAAATALAALAAAAGEQQEHEEQQQQQQQQQQASSWCAIM